MPVDRHASLAELATAMDGGQVEVLVILGGNPVFTAPADLKFAERLSKVGLVAYLGTHVDETAHLAHWNLPAAHALESWGDARAFDGTVTLMQPLVAPLYEGRSAHEVLALFTAAGGSPRHADREGLLDARIRRRRRLEHSRRQRAGIQGRRHILAPCGPRWLHRRHRGDRGRSRNIVHAAPVVAPPKPAPGTSGTGSHPRPHRSSSPTAHPSQPRPAPSPSPVATARDASRQPPAPSPSPAPQPPASGGLEIIFRPDPTIWDGSFANNGWLQELPKPLTKLTWDTSAWISPRLAGERDLHNGDVIEMQYRGNTAKMPVFIVPGHPQESVTVFFGYGRRMAGRVGNAVARGAAVQPVSAPHVGRPVVRPGSRDFKDR